MRITVTPMRIIVVMSAPTTHVLTAAIRIRIRIMVTVEYCSICSRRGNCRPGQMAKVASFQISRRSACGHLIAIIIVAASVVVVVVVVVATTGES